MGFAENRGSYWRGRYKIAPGRYGTVKDPTGATVRFPTRRKAEQAAQDEESRVRAGKWRDHALGQITFGEYVNRWFAEQDLAASSMESYQGAIEVHLLPEFEEVALADIRRGDINNWEKQEKKNYAVNSVKIWRKILHLILADAMDEGLIESNPAARRRGRGKRAGRSAARGPEKTITSPLEGLLLAERASILSGRDDEFVACVTKRYIGARWGEVVGLETRYVRAEAIRIEWQLYELKTGELLRCPPKDDSYRTVDAPAFLIGLLRDHMARTQPEPCDCHGYRYLFRGLGTARTHRPGAKLVDVARRAGVSAGTVSNVLNHPERVAEATRERVQAAAAELGFIPNQALPPAAMHWRRNGFATWIFQPAVTGWYPKKAPQEARPVPLLGEPWPGVPVRGRNAAGRADACWLPIKLGHTPHGERHSHSVDMDTLRTPKVLKDERMGHVDSSMSAHYSHVTDEMRRDLVEGLTRLWEEALDQRRALSPGSPVAVLDRLLRARG
ncbi:LacI family DNA-binding transcriptional regulator [Streptomyces sp. NPDC007083]|uniref:LacI family DNA-binding transcriptional regulator n=1 Tax=Streptomyces sp. NPDC007083 TaxID=3156913 RepID=UPI0033F7F897